jgi:hypothetical protein
MGPSSTLNQPNHDIGRVLPLHWYVCTRAYSYFEFDGYEYVATVGVNKFTRRVRHVDEHNGLTR